jgi:zinc transport system ATP-binding protein
MPVKIIEIENLGFSYNSIPVLEDISFSVEKGSFVGLVGPNGSGKTTLIKLILGLAKPFKGVIRLFGRNIDIFPDWARVGYLPQSVTMFNPYFPSTAREIVALGLLSGKRFPRYLSKSDDKAINGVLDLLGIAGFKDARVGELSGGQQQRILIARALVHEPELLILDEPTAALDPDARDSFFGTLKNFSEVRNTTIILVTHDIGNIGKYANHLLWIDRKLLFYGGFDDFCRSDRMTDLFGANSQHIICHRH